MNRELTAGTTATRSALVTGGYGALGTVVAQALLSAGYRVARVNHGAVPSELSGDVSGARSIGIGNTDLSNPEQARAAVAAAVSRFGELDVLVNVAGGFSWAPLADDSAATWDRLYAINVKTCLNTCVAVLPHLKEGGRIINIGALAAAQAGAGMGPYAAAKSAVARLTESLAAELQTRRITVNAVLPATMDTPENRRSMPGTDPAHMTRPEAVAEVIVFLASPASQAISGALIPVTNPY
jgi:NAD(P)-dependent dehydrogenase (short-subunit alcohol dehydrogenase family)